MELMNSDKQTVLLAPFQPVTRIELVTHINNNITCYLDIKNPADRTLNITVTKEPDVKRQIILNTTELEIPGKSNGVICIKWCPKEAGCWRDILQLTDSRRIKYDIAIATTAKENTKKVHKKLPKLTSSGSSRLSVPATKKHSYPNKLLNTHNIGSKYSSLNINTQVKQNKPKESNSSKMNKENIPNKYLETKIYMSQKEDDKNVEVYHCEHHKSTNNLLEQYSNVWNDGNTLPQFLLPSNLPHDIRRATYVKETRHFNSMLYSEETSEDTISYAKEQSESDFSMLINEIKFTDVIAPELVEKDSTGKDLHSTEDAHRTKNKTFNIDCKNFEISRISVPEINIDPSSISTGTQLLECHELSFKDDVKNLIASSPIIQNQYSNVQETEHFKYFVDHINSNTQTDYEYFSYTTIPENIEVVKEAGDIYIEISPPKGKSFNRKTMVSKNKTSNNKSVKLELFISSTTKKSKKNIPAIKINQSALHALRQVKVSSLSFEEPSYLEQTEENSIYEAFKPDPFAPSITENPFLKETMQYNDKWLSEQEIKFTNWLNALLSTPEDLRVSNIKDTITDTVIKCQSRKDHDGKIGDTLLTDGNESADCRTDSKLYVLRKAARIMICRIEVTKIKLQIDICVNRGVLQIRQDRNLHRDISLQKDILNLFLCYNPLWLRIGLETLYDERILLRHNNDLNGLTRFLLERFFTNPRLMKMPSYRKADPGKKFLAMLNQFMLKKFMFLIYFLDYAKQHKLIGHDPCLFRKRAAYKTSREILLHFSRNLLAGMGDVTKVLRAYGYVLTHQQTYIDEYEYDVMDIRRDLRDGVRLCRVMELIVNVNGLTRQCRVPAISRLQKIHNVDLALITLRQVGNVPVDDVDAKSIVEGHREKTLSLLWQIVHKVQAPRSDRAARVIQRWWRSLMWYIRVKNFLYVRRNCAATVIQRTWRKHKMWKVEDKRFTIEHMNFLRVKTAAICIQTWWRSTRESARMKKLRELKEKRLRAAIVLQRRWQATLLMRTQRNWYCHLRNTVLTIQIYWRARRVINQRRFEHDRLRENAATQIQSWWRSTKITREKREQFLRWKKSAFLIQRTWRRYQTRKRERWNACLKIQTWWRAISCSRRYELQKRSCVKLQCWWRDRQRYRMQQRAVLLIESWYLRVMYGKAIRQRYLWIRNATIRIQSWWRAILLAYEERRRYQQLRENTIILQKYWRRRTLARWDRQQFLLIKKACVTLQSQWRMLRIKRWYKRYRDNVLRVQRKWRAIRTGYLVRNKYQEIRTYTIIVQTRWRSSVARRRFLVCRQAAIVIQSYYKMRITARWYNQVKNAVLTIQFYWRRYKQKVKDELVLTDVQDKCKEMAVPVDQQIINKLPLNLSREFLEEQIITLRTSHSMGMLITCLSCLDTIVKLAPKICIILCQLNLADEIYNTISQRNRSRPWMEACERACSILITLQKYPYTKKCIIKQEYASLLVKLLNDTLKDKETFLSCATLIWYLIQDKDYLKAVTVDVNIQWQLKNIQQQFFKNTPMTKFQKSKKPHPNCEPDPRTRLFTSMDAAITAIMNRTNILVIRKSGK